MAKVITVDNRTFKEKLYDAKQKAKDTVHDIVDWAVENKELAIASIPLWTIAANGVVKGVNNVAKMRVIKAEEDVKKLNVYDRQNGMYLHLRKPLTASQKAAIDRRHRNGETLTQILMSMRMCK